MADMSCDEADFDSMLHVEEVWAEEVEHEARTLHEEPWEELLEEELGLDDEGGPPILLATPVRAPRPQQDHPMLPLQATPTSASSRATETVGTASRKRRTYKQGVVKTNPCEELRKQQLAFRDQTVLKRFGRLSQDVKRKWTKRVACTKCRLLERAKTGNRVTLFDGQIWCFQSETEFVENQRTFERAVLKSIAECSDRDDMERAVAMSLWLKSIAGHVSEDVELATSFRGNSALLTWQGAWGLLPLLAHEGPDDIQSITSLCHRLESMPEVICVWCDIKQVLAALKTKRVLTDYGVSLELCCKTLAEGVIRLHLHAWVSLPGPYNGVHGLQQFKFRDTVPFVSPFLLGAASRGHMSRYAGAFYVFVPKIGSIKQFFTKAAFKDYVVNERWITTLLVAQKITTQTAHAMYLLACSSAQMNIRNLDFITRQEQERQEQIERLAMEVLIRDKQMPFRKIREVEEWLQHYDDIQDRYKFLVLDGPSQMGKTRFAASLTSVEKFFYLDCSSCIMPDMRSFNRRHHELVLFDEIKATTVLSVKKLFQSSIDVVSLGSSQTNMNLYRIWAHRAKRICASNRWKAELTGLEAPDREWLDKNTVYIFVDRPLWEETCVGQAR